MKLRYILSQLKSVIKGKSRIFLFVSVTLVNVCLLLVIYSIQRSYSWKEVLSPAQLGKNFKSEAVNLKIQNKAKKKILSYSLFGNGTRLNSGNGEKYRDCIRILSEQASESELYKDWFIRIYHDEEMADDILQEHQHNKQIEFRNVAHIKIPNVDIDLKGVLGKFWRTLAIVDPEVEHVCFRDLDSDLTRREEYAVRDWMKTDKKLHVMRDHPQHLIGMLAGMWCFQHAGDKTKGHYLVEELFERVKSYKNINRSDQPLINSIFWRDLENDSIQHDAYTCKYFNNSKPFPTKRDEMTFIGCPSHDCVGKVTIKECPVECRPNEHQEWVYC